MFCSLCLGISIIYASTYGRFAMVNIAQRNYLSHLKSTRKKYTTSTLLKHHNPGPCNQKYYDAANRHTPYQNTYDICEITLFFTSVISKADDWMPMSALNPYSDSFSCGTKVNPKCAIWNSENSLNTANYDGLVVESSTLTDVCPAVPYTLVIQSTTTWCDMIMANWNKNLIVTLQFALSVHCPKSKSPQIPRINSVNIFVVKTIACNLYSSQIIVGLFSILLSRTWKIKELQVSDTCKAIVSHENRSFWMPKVLKNVSK